MYLRWPTSCTHATKDECQGDFSSHFLTEKSRVTPLNGMTIPRSELNGVLLESRLTLSVAKARSTEVDLKPSCVTLLADSECSISAIENTTSAFKPYFHNRLSEIKENLEEISKICHTEPIFHVPGTLNSADIATHSGVKIADIGPDSTWQRGPLFLSHRRDFYGLSPAILSN